jgi:hypothetical protein
MDSRKLLGAVSGMVGVVAIVALCGFRAIDEITAQLGITAVAGLGGFQIYRQALIDESKKTGG